MIKISIIVPVYNVEKYLVDCVNSLINQSVLPYEIILIDDGSKDDSPQICDDLKEKNNLIKVVHQANGGLSRARNKGIESATGDYLLFVDSDDTIDLNTCERFLNVLQDRSADLVVGNLRVVDENGIKGKPHFQSNSETIVTGIEYLVNEYKNHSMHTASVQCLYRRQFIIDNKLYFTPDLLHEDELFTPIVFYHASSVIPTDIEFYNHMMRENSITTQKNKTRNAESIIRIFLILKKETDKMEQKLLEKLIMEHCVDLYYKVYVDAKLIQTSIRIDKSLLIRYSKSVKNIVRTSLYIVNQNLFYSIERKRRNIK